jgi:hypothetical protein
MTLAANARYAASFHPVHRRAKGAGVAAAVGTELGSYSSARSATEERQRDRSVLFEENLDDALERAAQMGKKDATAFKASRNDTSNSSSETKEGAVEEVSTTATPSPTNHYVDSLPSLEAELYEGSDTFAVHGVEDKDLSSIYKSIQENKASRSVEMDEDEEEEMEDPGFRIYFVDEDTGNVYEVPPFTSPYEAEQIVAQEKQENRTQPFLHESISAAFEKVAKEEEQGLFGGYQAIEETNRGQDRFEAIRESRMKIRADYGSEPNIDESERKYINGASQADSSLQNNISYITMLEQDDSNLNRLYEQIRSNKEAKEVEMSAPDEEEPEMPDFRIYYVDEETGDTYEVPPFTSPQDMRAIVSEKKTEKEASKNDQAEAVNAEEYEHGEKTFDGYTDIQEANSRADRQAELEAMREARRKNRLGGGSIDASKIGVRPDI